MSLPPADTGVPGIVLSMRPMPLPNFPDAVAKSDVMSFGVLVAEERRRWCEVYGFERDGESRLGDSGEHKTRI
jgi:hypothetical protein